MSSMSRHAVAVLLGTSAMTAIVPSSSAEARVTMPTCEAAEPWALAIDAKDRWTPNPAQRTFWLPSAFGGDEFEALFGTAVTEWTRDDVSAARSFLGDCAKSAGGAKRYDVQKAFNRAAAFVRGNLRNYIVRNERASAKVDQALDALLGLPDSPELLQVLALLRDLPAGDRNGLLESQQAIRRVNGEAARAGRPILDAAQRQTPEDYAADTLPRIEARYEALRLAYLEEATDRIATHASGTAGLAEIEATLTALREQFAGGLPPEDYAKLGKVADGERAALRQAILEEARAAIDALPATPASLSEATAIVSRTAPSLDGGGTAALESHAAARQQAVARELMTAANEALARFPATLAGIDDLDRHVRETVGIVEGYLDDGRMEAFRAAAGLRRSAIARDALPEFEAHIAALSETPAGLEDLNAAAARIEQWVGLAPEVQAAYADAVAKRRATMEAAIAAAAEKREEERQRMVATATMARIDAMAPRFRSLDGIPREVEEARAKGLDPERMAEIEAHAAARRQAIADEILARAEEKLSETPETPEGLGELNVLVDIVIEEASAAATPAALAAFEGAASAATTALASKLFDGFVAELASLSEDRDGLESAEAALAWVKSWHHVDEDLRSRYVEAAGERRDEIAGALAAAEAERRERVLAAGGDPDLVGYTFADETGMSTLEFADEKRVILAVLGMRFGGAYEVVNDDIFVEGPNGTVVFARDGNTLTGMGLTLKRVEE